MVDVVLTGGPLPPDINYYLECSVECFNIPLDVYFWAKHFCPNTTQLVDELDQDPELRFETHTEALSKHCSRLERYYLDWQEHADINAVAVCLAFGTYYTSDTRALLDNMMNSLVLPTRDVLLSIPHYSNAIRYSENTIAYLDGVKLFDRQRGFFESRYRMVKQWETIRDQVDLRDIRLIQQPRPTLQQLRAVMEFEDNRNKRNARVIPKEKRKALKRSATLLDAVSGENTVQMFLSGEKVTVTGNKYHFVLTKAAHSSITNAHGTATTRVYDSDSGEFVCGLCVYSPGVTVFDHLASIVMHCKSGLEDLIIEEANITDRGNLEFLPVGKKKQLEKQRAANEAVVFEPAGPNMIEQAMYGSDYGIIKQQAGKVKSLNEQAQQKLSRRLMKKFPHLFVQCAPHTVNVDELFYQEPLPVVNFEHQRIGTHTD